MTTTSTPADMVCSWTKTVLKSQIDGTYRAFWKRFKKADQVVIRQRRTELAIEDVVFRKQRRETPDSGMLDSNELSNEVTLLSKYNAFIQFWNDETNVRQMDFKME